MSKERYSCKCPVCGHEFWAAKSLAHEMGILDGGHGSCPSCGTFHNLTLDEGNKKMLVKPWDKYINERSFIQ